MENYQKIEKIGEGENCASSHGRHRLTPHTQAHMALCTKHGIFPMEAASLP